ncbi:hypothetical protein [Shinella sp. NM-101]|uniref:hypothetical protein n=1 Tax=Shinella sp. NM-101 TaxID=2744455 RepID=UPI001F2E7814|nr:hypothetical protein [Shinella sp. NM-101]
MAPGTAGIHNPAFDVARPDVVPISGANDCGVLANAHLAARADEASLLESPCHAPDRGDHPLSNR